ncbi:MAG: CDC48 family AAA ATPase [Thermoplasmata archaeon]|nr:CDC48 family AAA ATPase [Thermoplasmata archaeon]
MIGKKKDELRLKVIEPRQNDIGRGIVRIDPKIIKKLELTPGDVVKITGTKSTVAKIWPALPEDEGSGAIRMDGILRRNSGAGIDENVTINKVFTKPAKSLVFSPTEPLKIMGGEEYLQQVLEGRVFSRGDMITINVMGRKIDLIVTSFKPAADAALLSKETAIKISEKPVKEESLTLPRVSYDDIGGLEEEVKKVREMIELPLRHPELFDKLGVEAPKGVLLHGPPGTGKTLLARAVASETEANFSSLSGPEVMSKFYGQSEENLREIFKNAEENAPSIIFIDEIDSIAPKRDEVSGEVERRVVAQLLALMDGLNARGKVVVIGATNRPNALDPALRRPGRFDREIEIGIPNRDARFEILKIHTRGMPLDNKVKLKKLSDLTHGYVGADIAALAKEAAMRSLRRVLPKMDLEAEEIPVEILNELIVTKDDFFAALRELEPSAMREVIIENPNVHWKDVGGLEKAKQELIEAIEWPLKYPKLFEHMNFEVPSGILLYGPPGTGKTLMAKAVATETEANFISVKGPEFFSKWVGESEKAVRETFKKAKQAAPCIVFFDEIDAIVPTRGGNSSDSHVTERIISQILTELDGLETLHGVVVIGATNRADIIDPALLRPGRFDRLVYIPVPDIAARKEIFKIHTRDKPISKNVDIGILAELTDNLNGAEIAAICNEAVMLAIREYLVNGGTDTDQNVKKARIKMDHFELALKKVAPRASKDPKDAAKGVGGIDAEPGASMGREKVGASLNNIKPNGKQPMYA